MGEGGLSGVGSSGGETGPVEELDFLGVGAWEGEGAKPLLELVC